MELNANELKILKAVSEDVNIPIIDNDYDPVVEYIIQHYPIQKEIILKQQKIGMNFLSMLCDKLNNLEKEIAQNKQKFVTSQNYIDSHLFIPDALIQLFLDKTLNKNDVLIYILIHFFKEIPLQPLHNYLEISIDDVLVSINKLSNYSFF